MVFLLVLLLVFLVVLAPAIWAIGHYLAHQLKVNSNKDRRGREDIIDAPFAKAKRAYQQKMKQEPTQVSYRAMLGQSLSALLFGVMSILFLILFFSGLFWVAQFFREMG